MKHGHTIGLQSQWGLKSVLLIDVPSGIMIARTKAASWSKFNGNLPSIPCIYYSDLSELWPLKYKNELSVDSPTILPLHSSSLSIRIFWTSGIELSMTLSADLPALDPLKASLYILQYYTTYPCSLMRFRFAVRNALFS